MCEMKLWGAGGECVVALDPPVVIMSQLLSVGKTYVRSVTLTNQSEGPTEIAWETYPDILYQAVRVKAPAVTLQPMERRAFSVEVTPKVVGELEVSLECAVRHGAALGLVVIAEVDGPRMRIEEACLDFGLMRVGDEDTRRLTLHNICDVLARWHLEVHDEGGHSEGVRMTPEKGMTDAGKLAQVDVSLKREAPERTRGSLTLQIEGGQPLFISYRAEVVYPCVRVSDLEMDLGTIFLKVPVTRRIFLRSTTLLPRTRFSWASAQAGPLSRAGGPVFSISFSVVEEELGPDETMAVDFVVEALTLGEGDEDDDRPGELGSVSRPGIMEALVPLDVDGMPAPTGFELRAKVMGLAVTYHIGTLETVPRVPDEIRGTPAALKVGVRTDWPPELLGPDTGAPCVLNFGTVEALTKQSRTLLIRNHTGIASVFSLHLERFGVAAHEILLAEAQAAQHALIQTGQTGATTSKLSMGRSATGGVGGSSGFRGSAIGRSHGGETGGTRTAMTVTQSKVTIGSLPTRTAPKVTKQTGTVATVRMGAVKSRAVATGRAARSITAAEQQMRELRASASWVDAGHKQLKSGLRPGHAESRIMNADALNQERKRMKTSALWCLPGDHSSVASRGHSGQANPRSRLILSDDHEDTERFRGAAGQELLNKRAQAEEAQVMLEEGQGVALTASCYEGELPAWGEVEVRVDVYSDMTGLFRDRLEVHVLGLQPVNIPVVGKLIGTPVTLEGGTLGIHKPDQSELPRLDLGDVLLGGNPIYRSLRVSNAGPWPAVVNFRLLEGTRGAGDKALVTLASSVNDDGRVSYLVVAVDPPEADDTPFTVDPPELHVPPHSSKTLTVSCAWDRPEQHINLLEGIVSVEKPEADDDEDFERDGALDPEEAHIGMVQHLGTAHRPLALPPLRIQMECNVQGAWLETDCHKHLRWTCSSTKDWKSHPSFFKVLNLSNRSRANLSFHLKVNPPFSIESTVCTAPLHPMVKAPSDKSLVNNPPLQLFTLPPNDNVQVQLRFTPPAKHRSGRVVDDALIFGELLVSFANEEEQKIRLQAHMLHPQIDCSPTSLNFQELHVESVAALTITMKNPTFCDARWSAVHKPKTLASTMSRSMGATSRGMTGNSDGAGLMQTQGNATTMELIGTDDPSVFTFDPPGGVIKGTGNRPSIPATTVLTVRFAPKDNGVYMSKFKIEVEGGRSETLILTGCGSYEENMEPGGSTGVIRDHPGYHPLLTGVRGPVVPNEATYGADMATTLHPAPQTLPSWYDMDKAMPPAHLTNYRRE